MKMYSWEKLPKALSRVASVALLSLGMASIANAQVSFEISDEIGAPGGSVSVSWNYTSDGSAAAIEGRFNFDNTLIDSVDYTSCTAGFDAPSHFTQCLDQNGTEDNVFFQILDTGSAPLPSAGGTIVFNLAASAPDGTVIDLLWDETLFVVEGSPAVTSTDGSITVQAGPPAVLGVTPPSINFGNVISPGTATETVTIANNGTAGAPDLDVTALTFSDAAFSAVGGTCGAPTFSVSAGSSCTVDVEFSAAAVQTYTGDLDVVSSVGTETVALEGEGTAGPVAGFDIDPTTAAFGTVDLGDMPQSIVHTITNDGDPGSTLELNDLSYSGDAEFGISSACPATLAQGASCTVTVTFDSAANGTFTGTVTAVTNVGTFEVPVTGEADSVPVLAVNPPFGPVDLGQAPAGTIITANGEFSNTGSAPGDVSCNITGPDAGIFSAIPSAGTIPAGGTVGFELACRLPDDAEQGDVFTADLNCSSPDDTAFDGTHNLSCGVQEFQFVPVPTMQPWALVLFSMLMLIAGGIGIRFFRAS